MNEAADKAENVMSRTGYAICYDGCPVLWCPKLKTEIVLSTAEAEYIALFPAIRKVIPFLYLCKELKFLFELHLLDPEVHCIEIEDSQELHLSGT